ncbi:lipopolysaccharide heptosyltransferase II [Massilia sp. SYSU DXS3249]
MSNDWNHAAHLLCVRLDSLGDVLMCTPAMRALRAQHPARRLTLLTSPAGAALAPHLPDVDQVLAYEAPWMKSSSADPPDYHVAQIAALAGHRFDGAVIFTCYSQSALPAALLCQLAGIPLRAAYCREKPYQLLTDWIADPEPGAFVRHEVQRQLDLVRHLGAEVQDERLSFQPLRADMAAVDARLRRIGIDPAGRWLVLHPGASAPARRYPQRHWSSLIRQLHERIGCPMVLTGGAHEMSLIDGIDVPAEARVHSLAGQLSLGELGALLAQASLVVSNNTGPAHLAAAVGTPVVDLYALTNPQHTPWRVPSRVLNHDVGCRYCHRSVCPEGHHDCMEKLAPSQVVDAVCSLLKQTEPYRTREGMPTD